MLVRRVALLVAVISAIVLYGGWGWQAVAQAAQDEEGNESGESGNLTLKVAGDEGTRFSGVCSVGDEERDISGRVPQSFEFTPDDRQLACQIRKQDSQDAGLKVVLRNENTRSVHRSEGGEDTVVRLVYEAGTVSSSMSSSSSQKTSNTSGSSTANDTERRDDDPESLADRILKKVDEILEQSLP